MPKTTQMPTSSEEMRNTEQPETKTCPPCRKTVDLCERIKTSDYSKYPPSNRNETRGLGRRNIFWKMADIWDDSLKMPAIYTCPKSLAFAHIELNWCCCCSIAITMTQVISLPAIFQINVAPTQTSLKRSIVGVAIDLSTCKYGLQSRAGRKTADLKAKSLSGGTSNFLFCFTYYFIIYLFLNSNHWQTYLGRDWCFQNQSHWNFQRS